MSFGFSSKIQLNNNDQEFLNFCMYSPSVAASACHLIEKLT